MTKVDPILESIGGRGRYQVLQYFLVNIVLLSTAFQLLNIVFVGRNVPHECKKPANISDVYNAIDNNFIYPNNSVVHFEKCQIHVVANISGSSFTSDLPCLYGYQYEEKKETSVISDMDIVCDEAPLRGLGLTLFVLGQGIGAVGLPPFSDRYGRRTVLLISHTCLLALGVGIAFAPNFIAFLVMRIFLGIVQQGIVLAKNTVSIELFSKQHRKLLIVLNSILWNPFLAIIPLIAYLMEAYSWRYTHLVYCSVSLYVIIQFFVVDESLMWLITNRKTKQVEKNLKKASRISGKDTKAVLAVYRDFQDTQDETLVVPQSVTDQMKTLLNTEEEGSKKMEKKKDPTKPSLLELLKRKRLALTVVVLWFTWLVEIMKGCLWENNNVCSMTDGMTFYGLYMTVHSLAGNRYLNFFLLGVFDLPSCLILYNMVDRIGRRKASTIFHAVGGISLIAATIVKQLAGGQTWTGTAVTVLTCIGMFGASTAWNVSLFIAPELFPTNLRNFGLGTASCFSRLGGMLAPFASLVAEYVPWAPGAIFGGCCLLVSILVNILPETMGRELPHTLDDMVEWYKDNPKKKSDNGDNRKT